MALPGGLTTILVTADYSTGGGFAGGAPVPGSITFTPSTQLVDPVGHVIIPTAPIPLPLVGGQGTVELLCTDNADVSPSGWYWIVTQSVGSATYTFDILLPHTLGAEVDLDTLAPVTPGPAVSTLYGLLAAPNTNAWASNQIFSGPVEINDGLTIEGTAIANPPGGTTEFLRADGTWDVPAGGGGISPPAGDIGGTTLSPQVISTHLAAALPLAQGGTGQTTQQSAINALTGTQSAGRYLRSDGTNATLAAIQAADVPTLNQNTSGTAAGLSATLAVGSGGTGQTTQQNAITALTGSQAAGHYLRSDGTNATLAAIQAGDVPVLNQNTTGTAGNVTGTVAIGNGGTGQTTQQSAITALTGTQSAGRYLRSDGTNATLAAIQAADVPTLNQNTSGTAAGLSATLAVGSGGTGQTTAQAAINALTGSQAAGHYLRSDGTNATLAAIQATDVPTLNQSTTGTAGNVTGTVAIGNGGTGQTTQQSAINALTGTQSAGRYLRSDGTNATLAAIQAADVPTLNQNTSGTAAGLSATLAVGSGGTGQTTQQNAINALTGAQAAGAYLRSDGTNATLAAIQAGDVPTLNQNTTGTAANASAVGGITVTGTPTSGQGLTATSSSAASWQSAPDAYAWDTPHQRGFKEWLFPLTTGYLNQSFTSGTVYGATFIAQTNSTISKVAVAVTSSAGTPVAGENLIGFYTVSGTTWTQATVTGDLGGWGSAGLNEYTFGASETLVPGTTYMLLLLSVASSAVHLGGFTGNQPFTNTGCSQTAAPWMKYFTYGTGQTTLPASFTASSSTLSTTAVIFPWAALL